MSRAWSPIAAFLVMTQVGCDQRVGPDVAWTRFVEATQKGDAETAWSLLSKKTQEAFTRAAIDVAEARGIKKPEDGRTFMLSARSSLVARPKVVEARFDSNDDARVIVLDENGERGSVQAVREEGQWRIDLTQALPKP